METIDERARDDVRAQRPGAAAHDQLSLRSPAS
jgi:hypothetical protein